MPSWQVVHGKVRIFSCRLFLAMDEFELHFKKLEWPQTEPAMIGPQRFII